MNFAAMVRAVSRHPLTTLATAVILIGTSAAEVWETLEHDFQEANVGAHHGVFLFGLVSLISVVPDLIEGFERLATHHWDKS